MTRDDKCLPCILNQAIKVANIVGVDNKDELLRDVFTYLSKMDYHISTPEIIGEIFEKIKLHTHNDDPYKETRIHYNKMFLELIPEFENKIEQAENSFLLAIKYAIIGNIIDFNPMHNTLLDDVLAYFNQAEHLDLEVDDSNELLDDMKHAKTILYLGDNCGEICLDRLLLKKITEVNLDSTIYFGVRGKAVVNDSIEEDAYFVGIDKYANIINNGDGSLGTVLQRTSSYFNDVYERADLIIAKGQANYECLSEENKNIYFLLMTKCDVIAKDIGVEEKKLICMRSKSYIG